MHPNSSEAALLPNARPAFAVNDIHKHVENFVTLFVFTDDLQYFNQLPNSVTAPCCVLPGCLSTFEELMQPSSVFDEVDDEYLDYLL